MVLKMMTGRIFDRGGLKIRDDLTKARRNFVRLSFIDRPFLLIVSTKRETKKKEFYTFLG